MHRQAKNPGGTHTFSGQTGNNTQCLSYLIKSLTTVDAVNTALCWEETKEGHNYWGVYYRGDLEGGRLEEARGKIRAYIGLLATPLKPINKEDWL